MDAGGRVARGVRILETRMDRVRLAIPVRSRRAIAALITGAGLLWIGIGAIGWGALPAPAPAPAGEETIPPLLVCPSSDPQLRPACAALSPALAEAPGLFEAYLARRHHHLTVRLPAAFPEPEAPLPALPLDWARVASGADAALVRQILRDATRDPSGWAPRDPVAGAGLLGLAPPSDDEVRAARGRSARLGPLPDRRGVSVDVLVEERVIRSEGDGRYALFAAPEADHIVEAALADVKRYDGIRAAAFHSVSEGRRTAAFVERERIARERAARAAARAAGLGRWFAVQLALALLVAVVSGAGLARLRARAVVVTFDGHGMTLGRHRLSWEDLVDLTWREDRVDWTTSQGEDGLGGLSLSEAEVTSLQRAVLSLRTARFTAGGEAGRAALDLLVGRVRRQRE